MPRKALARLMSGFRQFREKFYLSDDPTYSKLKTGYQGPKTLLIGCSDSRVDPAILGGTGPGEIFMVRNVANLVPPFETGGGHHGVSAAIEFAVVNLEVENVIILGHRQCGGIRALLFPKETHAGGFVKQWMKIAEPAKERVLAEYKDADQLEQWQACELESIRISLENLRTFPFVRDAIRDRGMQLLGVYFDIEKGELRELDEATGKFSVIPV